MSKACRIALLACLALTLSVTSSPAQPVSSRPLSLASARTEFATGEILVQFRKGARAASIEAFNRSYGSHIERHLLVPGWTRVTIPAGADVEAMVASYRASTLVERAEPNYIYRQAVHPNDPFYDNYNGVLTDLQRWYYVLLQGPGAWDVETGCSDVVLAIVDSGIDLDHPDLASNIWTNPGEIGGNGTDDDGNGFIDDVYGMDFAGSHNGNPGLPDAPPDNNPDVFSPDPSVGDGLDNDGDGYADAGVFHGTFAAGCAGAVTNNGVGVAGGAWQVTLMAVRVMNPEGWGYVSDIADGITYATMNGADIINLSLGGGFSSAIDTAVNNAVSAGVVVVAAAGNGNSQPIDYPAQNPNTIAVGASDSGSIFNGGSGDTDGRASFSNWGLGTSGNRRVDCVAPGVDIVSSGVESAAETSPGSPAYYIASGTSFSTPLVAGGLALYFCKFGPQNTATVKTAIAATALDLPNDPNDIPNAGAAWDGNGMFQYANMLLQAGPVPAVTCPGPQDGLVGQQVCLTFRIDNTGIMNDDFDYEITSTQGWFSPITGSQFVQAGFFAEVNQCITIPVSASSAEVDDVTFIATSQADPAQSDTCSTPVTALLGPVALALCPGDTSGCPGDSLALEFSVVNVGDAADDFAYDLQDGAGWMAAVAGTTVLAPGDTAALPVLAPVLSATGSSTFQLAAYPLSDPSAGDTCAALVDVEACQACLTLACPPDTFTAEPGDTLALESFFCFQSDCDSLTFDVRMFDSRGWLAFEMPPGNPLADDTLSLQTGKLGAGQAWCLSVAAEAALQVPDSAPDGDTTEVCFAVHRSDNPALAETCCVTIHVEVQSTPAGDLPGPAAFALRPNVPNPFNPATSIRFDLPRASRVRITLYDAAGRLVTTLLDAERGPGSYEVLWQGRNDRGQRVSSGIYFVVMDAGVFHRTRKITLLK